MDSCAKVTRREALGKSLPAQRHPSYCSQKKATQRSVANIYQKLHHTKIDNRAWPNPSTRGRCDRSSSRMVSVQLHNTTPAQRVRAPVIRRGQNEAGLVRAIRPIHRNISPRPTIGKFHRSTNHHERDHLSQNIQSSNRSANFPQGRTQKPIWPCSKAG